MKVADVKLVKGNGISQYIQSKLDCGSHCHELQSLEKLSELGLGILIDSKT